MKPKNTKMKKILISVTGVTLALLLLIGSNLGLFAQANEANSVNIQTADVLPEETQEGTTEETPAEVPTESEATEVPVASDSIASEPVSEATSAAENSAESAASEAAVSSETTSSEATSEEETEVLPAVFAAGDVTVDVTPNSTSFQTYNNALTGTGVQSLQVTVSVVLNSDTVENTQIVLPGAFSPNATDYPAFDSAYYGKQFLLLDKTSMPAATGIIEKYEVDDTTGEVTIFLKDNQPKGSQTVNFFYTLNYDPTAKTGYISSTGYGVIPNKTKLITTGATIISDGAEVGNATSTTDVLANANTYLMNFVNKFVPDATSDYVSGGITTRDEFRLYNIDSLEIDTSAASENFLFADLPEDSVPSTAFLNFYNFSSTPEKIVRSADGKTYDRYKKSVTVATFTGQSTDYKYATVDAAFTPPTYTDGDVFKMYRGMSVKFVNQSSANYYEAAIQYTKGQAKSWDLNLDYGFATGNSDVARTIIGSPGVAGRNYMYSGYTTYGNGKTIKNKGAADVTGLKNVIGQARNENGQQAAFNQVILYASRDTSDSATTPAWTTYRLDVEVTDWATGNVVETRKSDVFKPSSTGATAGIDFGSGNSLFTIAAGQYISSISLVPMGSDGLSEGVLNSKNGFGVRVSVGDFVNQQWPNGEAMSPTVILPTSKIYYDDANDVAQIYNVPLPYNNGYFYLDEYTTAVTSSIVAANSSAVPGGTVSYNIQSKNDTQLTENKWQNPSITIGVPEMLTLNNKDSIVLTVLSGGQQVPVTVEELPVVAGYRYYKFTANGYSAVGSWTDTAFNIPVSFTVASGTVAGTYNFKPIVSSSADATKFNQTPSKFTINTLSASEASNYGMGSADNYMVNSTSTVVTVASEGSMSSTVAVKGSVAGSDWLSASGSESKVTVPAAKNSTVELRVSLKNTGNTVYNDIKLYDLLPYDGDALGSSGDIAFLDATATKTTAGGTSSTATPVMRYLPKGYGPPNMDSTSPKFNLQTETVFMDDGSGWDSTAPADPISLYVDFETLTIDPGDTVSVTMRFKIPDEDAQKAYTRFAYSAIETGQTAATAATYKSNTVGFSTDMYALNYVAYVPDNYPLADGQTAQDVVLNLPDAQMEQFISGTTNSLAFSTQTPTLVGYTFAGWEYYNDVAGKWANAGSTHTFLKAQTVTVRPKWTVVPYTVTFDANGGSNSGSGSATANFNTTIAESDFTAQKATQTNYTFARWTTAKNGSGTVFTKDTVIKEDITVYAQWNNNYVLDANNALLSVQEVTDATAAGTLDNLILSKTAAAGYTEAAPTVPTTVTVEVGHGIAATEGIYTVTLKTGATENGTENYVTKTVKVAVGSGTVVGDNWIQAKDFSIYQGTAKTNLKTDPNYIDAASAVAKDLTTGNAVLIDVDSSAVDASFEPNTYLVKFTTDTSTDKTKEASTTIKMTIYEDGTKVDPEVPAPPTTDEAIQAKSFELQKSEIPTASTALATYVSKGHAKAWKTDGSQTTIPVATATTSVVQNTTLPGLYPITFATGTTTNAETTVGLRIVDGSAIIVDGKVINAKDFTVELADITAVAQADRDAKYLEWASVAAWTENANFTSTAINLSEVEIDASTVGDTVEAKTYNLTFSLDNGPSITVIMTVNDAHNHEDNGSEGISANNIYVKQSDIAILQDSDYVEKSHAKAWKINADKSTTDYDSADIKVDASALKVSPLLGKTHKVVYTTPTDGLSVNTLAYVSDKDSGNTSKSEGISANNIVVSQEDAKAMRINPSLYITEADVETVEWDATGVVTVLDRSEVTVDLSKVDEDVANKSYPVTYTSKSGEVNVVAYVTIYDGSVPPEPPVDGAIIIAEDVVVGVEESKTYTNDKYIEESGAQAWLMKNNASLDVVIKSTTVQAGVEGTYSVTYATDRQDGSANAEVTRKIIITDAVPPIYNNDETLVAKDITITVATVTEYAGDSAKYVKAAGAKAWKNADNSEVQVTANVGLVQAVPGMYQATYTTAGGLSVNRTVEVTENAPDEPQPPVPNPVITKEDKINAYDFVISSEDAENLVDDAAYISYAKASAYKFTRDENTGEISNITDMKSDITVENKIADLTKGNTTHLVTYKLSSGTQTTIKVTITDGNPVFKDGEAIIAETIKISEDDSKQFTDEDYLRESGAKAWTTDGNNTELTVKVKADSNKVVKGKEGTYDITYQTTTATATEITKRVVVTNGNDPIIITDSETLTAKNISVTFDELAAFTDQDYIDRSNARAWSNTLKDGNGNSLPVVVNKATFVTTPLPNVEDTYDIEYETVNNTKLIAKVAVTNGNHSNPDDKTKETIVVDDFSVYLKDVGTLQEADYISRSNARAWVNGDRSDTVLVTQADYSAVKAEKGTYAVIYKTDKNTSVTGFVKVLPDDHREEPNPKLQETIIGKDFTLTVDEVTQDLSTTGGTIDYLSKGDVSAWKWDDKGVNTAFANSDITVDATNVQATPKTYTVFYTLPLVAGETTATKLTLYVTVVANGKVDPENNEAIQAEDFTIKSYEVAGLNDAVNGNANYIAKAKAKAWSTDPNTLNDNVAIKEVDYSAVTQVSQTQKFPVTFKTDKGTEFTIEVTVEPDNVVLVTFDGNEADVEANPRAISIVEPSTVLSNLPSGDPSRVGYSFVEWNTEKSGNGTKVEAGDTFLTDTTVYAKWSINSYVLSFDTQGEGSNPASQTLVYATKATEPSALSKKGHSFIGWYTSPVGGNRWDFATNTMPGNNLTLYAQFEANKYQVTFDYNGAGSVAYQSVVYDTPIPEPVSPTLYGYTFLGWKDSNGNAWDFATVMPDHDVVLKAEWEHTPYTVTYMNYNESEVIASYTLFAGDLVPTAQAPSVGGHHFAYWGVKGSENKWSFYNAMPANDLVLIARYDKNPEVPDSSSSSKANSGTASSKANSGGGNSPKSSSGGTSKDSTTSTTSATTTEGNAETSSNTSSSSAVISSSDANSTAGVTSGNSNGISSGEVPTVVPEGTSDANSWSLIALILTIASVVLSVVLLVLAFKAGNSKIFGIIGAVIGVVSIILFFVTNKLGGDMVLFNSSAIYVAVVAILQVVAIFLTKGNNEDDSQETEE